jgi:nitrogen fixation NifU-like protein
VSELDDLYQEVILDHNRSPRNFGAVTEPDRSADGYNPLCGDRVHLTLRVRDKRIGEARFAGDGCAISRASASLMTEALAGKSEEEARALLDAFHALVTGEPRVSEGDVRLGKLAAFEGVRRFPVRVKCAMLAWRTLEAALAQRAEPASTE